MTVSDWMNDKKAEAGVTEKNVEYLRQFKQFDHDFGGYLILTYMMMTRLHIEDIRSVFYSAKKQRKFCKAVKMKLKEQKVTPKWEKVFDRNCNSIRKRLDYIAYIVGENFRMTEYYPWYINEGRERLRDFTVVYQAGDDETGAEARDALLAEINAYNESHQKEIADHMAAIAEEKANMERHREQMAADKRAEKASRRAVCKAETAEVQEIRENAKKHRARQKKVDRSMQYMYRDADRYNTLERIKDWEGANESKGL